jgi:NADP-dependent 3-hydroxy acid dehydrogenase YdfG
MIKKVICITGGSSGFGFEVAKVLAEKGHSVYAGARSLDKMEPLKALGVHVLPLNVTDEKSVKAFADEVMSRESRIDVLINNAGYGA